MVNEYRESNDKLYRFYQPTNIVRVASVFDRVPLNVSFRTTLTGHTLTFMA